MNKIKLKKIKNYSNIQEALIILVLLVVVVLLLVDVDVVVVVLPEA